MQKVTVVVPPSETQDLTQRLWETGNPRSGSVRSRGREVMPKVGRDSLCLIPTQEVTKKKNNREASVVHAKAGGPLQWGAKCETQRETLKSQRLLSDAQR